jgi:hypothetical protein
MGASSGEFSIAAIGMVAPKETTLEPDVRLQVQTGAPNTGWQFSTCSRISGAGAGAQVGADPVRSATPRVAVRMGALKFILNL